MSLAEDHKIITPLGFKKWLFQVVYDLNLSLVLVYIECLGLRWISTKHSSIATPQENIVPSLKLTVRPWKMVVGIFQLPFGVYPIFQVLCLLVSGIVTGKLWGDSKVYILTWWPPLTPSPNLPEVEPDRTEAGRSQICCMESVQNVGGFYCWWQPEIRWETHHRKDGARTLDK